MGQKLVIVESPAKAKTIEKYLGKMEGFSHSDVEKSSQIIMKQCILEGRKLYTKHDVEYAILKQEMNVALRKTQY